MTSTVSHGNAGQRRDHGDGNGQRQRQQAAQPGHDGVEDECEQHGDRRWD